nr:heparan-alpha-glucosaminide N-acetyltransferase domain-containing protein [Myxococcota bacterium]
MSGFTGESRPTTQPQRSTRLGAIDAARGVAVLAMIEWHAADAWLDTAGRESFAFGWMQRVGGLAAPGFVLLAGLAIALVAPERPDVRQTALGVARGLRIVLAGYALGLFACAVDHGGVLEPRARVSIVAMALGLAALWAATTGSRSTAV